MSNLDAPTPAGSRPSLESLTKRQLQVLDAIRKLLEEQGFAPSLREIGKAANLKSTSSVQHQLHALESKGFIRRDPNKGRAIELVETQDGTSGGNPIVPFDGMDLEPSDFLDVPLVGAIAAGQPITAEQHVEDVMRLPVRLTGTGNLFMLEVKGDSMIDAAICDGDFVVVREQHNAENGDIVAALLDDEATVKTFRQ